MSYVKFKSQITEQFAVTANRPVFKTPAQDLWGKYLANLNHMMRQEHNCRTCKHFIERYGGLVIVDATGKLTSAIWPKKVPAEYQDAANALREAVEACGIDGVFYNHEAVLGTPQTQGRSFTHVFVRNLSPFKSAIQSDDQKMAEKLQDFHTVKTAMREWTVPQIKKALLFLQSDALFRAEKVIGPAEWLLKLHEQEDRFGDKHKNNAFWLSIATAPAGFLHPKASMVGSLLDDIASGLDFEACKNRFKEKMDPMKYQRPTVVTGGNIAQAEKIVSQLGIENSLVRRYAKLEECQTLWLSRGKEAKDSFYKGMFGGLKPTLRAAIATTGNMTWRHFSETILKGAFKIEYFVPSGMLTIYTITAAANEEAPLIFQWDNPYAWYTWQGGSQAHSISMPERSWVEVAGILEKPCHWGGNKCNHFPEFALFALKGAMETRNEGSAIFPETLKSELHSIRSTIEAFSKKHPIGGMGTPTVTGPAAQPNIQCPLRLRVTNGLGITEVTIDRWE